MPLRDSTGRVPSGALPASISAAVVLFGVACLVASCATVHGPGGSPGAPAGDDDEYATLSRTPDTSGAPRAPEAKKGGSKKPRSTAKAPAVVGSTQSGLATYYSDALRGHKTANGDRYDPEGMTAAHRTLPLGTWVRVSTQDGREVEVRINDRGPFGNEDRIIDLSKHAARELGILKRGVAPITLRVIDAP